jgi:hypothetical protein
MTPAKLLNTTGGFGGAADIVPTVGRSSLVENDPNQTHQPHVDLSQYAS